MSAGRTFESSIDDIASLRPAVLKASKNRKWEPDHLVIIKIVTAPFATILVSQPADSKLELSAGGHVSIEALKPGDTSLSLSTKRKSGIMVSLPAANISPFFQLARVNSKWWRKDEVELLGTRDVERVGRWHTPLDGLLMCKRGVLPATPGKRRKEEREWPRNT